MVHIGLCQSANGAKYESQGQARSEASASPLDKTANDFLSSERAK